MSPEQLVLALAMMLAETVAARDDARREVTALRARLAAIEDSVGQG